MTLPMPVSCSRSWKIDLLLISRYICICHDIWQKVASYYCLVIVIFWLTFIKDQGQVHEKPEKSDAVFVYILLIIWAWDAILVPKCREIYGLYCCVMKLYPKGILFLSVRGQGNYPKFIDNFSLLKILMQSYLVKGWYNLLTLCILCFSMSSVKC